LEEDKDNGIQCLNGGYEVALKVPLENCKDKKNVTDSETGVVWSFLF